MMLDSTFITVEVKGQYKLVCQCQYSRFFCRFFSGMGHVGTFIICFTLSVEYVGAKSRVFTGSLIEVPFSIGKYLVVFISVLLYPYLTLSDKEGNKSFCVYPSNCNLRRKIGSTLRKKVVICSKNHFLPCERPLDLSDDPSSRLCC